MAVPATKAEVYELLRLYNIGFFGGVLPRELPVHWARLKHYGDTHEPSGRHPYGLIRISTMLPPGVYWWEVLLHEACHAYLDLFSVDEYEHGVVAYHGETFCAEVNRIGEMLGMPPVELDDCWYWPWAVHLDYSPEPARE